MTVSYVLDLQHEKTQVLLTMYKNWESGVAIGKALGCTKQTVSELIDRVARIHGPDHIKRPDLVNHKDLAKCLGTSAEIVIVYCDDRSITFTKKLGQGYWFTEEQVTQAARTIKRICTGCQKQFVPQKSSHYTCSRYSCVRKRTKQLRETRHDNGPNLSKLPQWKREIYNRVCVDKTPKVLERWFTTPQAVEYLETMTKSQLYALGSAGIIERKSNDKKLHKGQPTFLYKRSHLAIVKEVYDEYKKNAR